MQRCQTLGARAGETRCRMARLYRLTACSCFSLQDRSRFPSPPLRHLECGQAEMPRDDKTADRSLKGGKTHLIELPQTLLDEADCLSQVRLFDDKWRGKPNTVHGKERSANSRTQGIHSDLHVDVRRLGEKTIRRIASEQASRDPIRLRSPFALHQQAQLPCGPPLLASRLVDDDGVQ